ncbi:MAG: N-acetylmuramoyl-L-alanine amidase, partial [Deltaproteobacteria bacterium]|nr:N-acetylmuramoyl-L-alanine amidase [Deltaproteobacteria bacterium]
MIKIMHHPIRKDIIGIIIIFIFALLCTRPQVLFAAGFAAESFQKANKYYIELTRDAKKRKYRINWIKVISAYSKVAQQYPHSKFAPKALYMKGKLYIQLYGYSTKTSDLEKAINVFDSLAKRYPKSSLADDAIYKSARIYDTLLGNKKKAYELYRLVITKFPNGDMAQKAREGVNAIHIKDRPSTKTTLADLVLVNNIRQWSNKEYTRVVIDLERNISFDTTMLPPNPKLKKGPRLVIDLNKTRIPPQFPSRMDVADGNLSCIRIAQNQKDKVRVVLDLTKKAYYNAFPLENPSRLVIDVSTEKDVKQMAQRPFVSSVKKVRSGAKAKVPSDIPSIARQLSLKVSRIVIDPGHGGKDPGAIGPHGEREKDIALAVSKRLANRLKKEGFDVFLTRETDVFIPLEERTAFANKKKADLFISIHANANRNRSTCGVETYFLNLTTDETAIQVAARENATTSKSISSLQLIINDLMLNSKINESSKFAKYVHTSIIKSLKNGNYKRNDLGVKQAPFYVLLGAQMPSILIEIGFITHSRECLLLRNSSYQNTIINGIAKGINTYII